MNRMIKGILQKRSALVLLLAVLAAAAGTTGAAVLHSLRLDNSIKTPPVEGIITENLENGGKTVSFTNTGEADVFLRVAWGQTWSVSKEEGGKKTALPNELKRKKEGAGKAAEAKNADDVIRPAVPVFKSDDWYLDREDGWYYYKRVLPGSGSGKAEGERSTAPLVTGVDFSGLEEAEGLDPRYEEADYRLHFTMETVQASAEPKVSEDAVREIFQKEIALNEESWQSDRYRYEIAWPSGMETAENSVSREGRKAGR